MNKGRRKTIGTIVLRMTQRVSLYDCNSEDQLDPEAYDSLSSEVVQYKADIQAVRDEEEEAYDNLPDGLRDGSRGDSMQEAMTYMDEAISKLDEIGEESTEAEIVSALQEAGDELENISE